MQGERAAREFANEAVGQFGAEIQSIVLTGSYARGEATETSDVDLWCVFDRLQHVHLMLVSSIVQRVSTAHQIEVNPQCVSVSEFIDYPSLGTVSVVMEGKLLHGQLPAQRPSVSDVLAECRSSILESILSCRHYITAAEPPQKLAAGNLRRYVLKPYLCGLRLERYLVTGAYPLSPAELLQASSGTRSAEVVSWATTPSKLRMDLESDHLTVLAAIMNAADEACKSAGRFAS